MAEKHSTDRGAAQRQGDDDATVNVARGIFEQIGVLAAAVDDACTNVDLDDIARLQNTLFNVQTLVSQMGLLSDLGISKTGGCQIRGGVEEWLLPAGAGDAGAAQAH
jgi:hypothetical protein